MLKLIAATLAVLFAILHSFGDPTRKPTVARNAINPEVQGLTLAAFASVPGEVQEKSLDTPPVSETEAIRMALAAGAKARSERRSIPLRGFASAEMAVEMPAAAVIDFWYVTGTRVNLRKGPGTGNAVVAQVTLGTEAEVLDSQKGWHQIRTADGAVSGWIYGKYLDDQRPG